MIIRNGHGQQARVQRFDAYVTYTATRTVDGADERAAIGCLLRSRPEKGRVKRTPILYVFV